MLRAVTGFLVGVCVALWAAPVHAQFGGVAVGFRNELKVPVIVQGYSVVNGMQKRGQAFVILPARAAVDLNVPAGLRFYTIVDANQPALTYIRNLPIPVGTNDLRFAVRGVPPKVAVQVLP